MEIRKTLRKIGLALLATLLLLTTILVVHIISVTPDPIDNATIQISRIDFDDSINEEQEKEIKTVLKSLEGVKSWRINKEKGVAVFFHDNRYLQANDAVISINNNTNLKANLFELPESLANKEVCPVDRDGFAYQFSKGIQRVFN